MNEWTNSPLRSYDISLTLSVPQFLGNLKESMRLPDSTLVFNGWHCPSVSHPVKVLPPWPNCHPSPIAPSQNQGSTLSWHNGQHVGAKAIPQLCSQRSTCRILREQNLHRRTQHHLINASAPKGQDQELPWPSCSQSHPQLNLKWVVQSLPPPLAKEANEVVPFKSVSQTLLSFQHRPARNLPSVGRGKIYTQGTMNEQN